MTEFEQTQLKNALGGEDVTPELRTAFDRYALCKSRLSLGEVQPNEIPGIILSVELAQAPEPKGDSKGVSKGNSKGSGSNPINSK